MTETRIEQEISTLEWANDKGIDSPSRQIIALLVALNEVVIRLDRIAEGLRK